MYHFVGLVCSPSNFRIECQNFAIYLKKKNLSPPPKKKKLPGLFRQRSTGKGEPIFHVYSIWDIRSSSHPGLEGIWTFMFLIGLYLYIVRIFCNVRALIDLERISIDLNMVGLLVIMSCSYETFFWPSSWCQQSTLDLRCRDRT
jgi:hypothetical protein